MRRIKFLTFVLSFLILAGFNSIADTREGDDNYGKLIGSIVEPETGEPVNEVFIIDFLDCDEIDTSRNFLRRIRTNEKGFFP